MSCCKSLCPQIENNYRLQCKDIENNRKIQIFHQHFFNKYNYVIYFARIVYFYSDV